MDESEFMCSLPKVTFLPEIWQRFSRGCLTDLKQFLQKGIQSKKTFEAEAFKDISEILPRSISQLTTSPARRHNKYLEYAIIPHEYKNILNISNQ
jgi:hypothetical protein